jgi:ribonuclease-3
LFSSLLSNRKKSKDELKLIRFIIDKFGYRPKNIALFVVATTHRSIISKTSNEESNERLEFLGDSILGSVIAEWLYTKFPEEDEGYLTQLKSKIVSRKILSEIAEKLELRKIIQYNNSRSINLSSIEGNCLEAMFGAMYLDGGFTVVKQCILQHIFRKYVNVTELLTEESDFKSKLFILCQKNKWSLDFLIKEERNEKNQTYYSISVQINEKEYGIGRGNSKKEAEQEASKITLEQIDNFL